MYLGVLLDELGEVVEEGVLGLEEVKVVVHSFLLHQRRQELLAVLRNELRSQLDRVTAR
jgi:dsDNA-binding SOS-regulon protein